MNRPRKPVVYGSSHALLSALKEAREALEAAAKDLYDMEHEGELRAIHICADEDDQIWHLCERIGYGAVMDSAARQWRRKDDKGAFLVGPCVLVAQLALSRARTALGRIREMGEK